MRNHRCGGPVVSGGDGAVVVPSVIGVDGLNEYLKILLVLVVNEI